MQWSPKKLIIVALALVAVGISLFFMTDRRGAAPAPSGVGGNASSTTGEWKTYRNERYGFEVDLPASWVGYRATAHEYGENADYYADVCFSFDAPHPPYCVFQISIFTKRQWQVVTAQSPKMLTPKSERGDFIFSFENAIEPKEKFCLELDDFLCTRKLELFSRPIEFHLR